MHKNITVFVQILKFQSFLHRMLPQSPGCCVHRHPLVDSTREHRDVPGRVRVSRVLRHRHPQVDSTREHRDVPGRVRVSRVSRLLLHRLLRHRHPLVDSQLVNVPCQTYQDVCQSLPAAAATVTYQSLTGGHTCQSLPAADRLDSTREHRDVPGRCQSLPAAASSKLLPHSTP